MLLLTLPCDTASPHRLFLRFPSNQVQRSHRDRRRLCPRRRHKSRVAWIHLRSLIVEQPVREPYRQDLVYAAHRGSSDQPSYCKYWASSSPEHQGGGLLGSGNTRAGGGKTFLSHWFYNLPSLHILWLVEERNKVTFCCLDRKKIIIPTLSSYPLHTCICTHS